MFLLYIAVPSLVTSEPNNASVVRGQPLCISLEYLANPVAIFTWYINDNLYVDAEPIPQLYNNYHKMVFDNATEEGWYWCKMQNELGTAKYAVFVDILSKKFSRCYYILIVICGFLYLCSTTPDHFCK